MRIRPALAMDYPELRRIYLVSRRQSFVWENEHEMSLEDFDRDTVDEYILLAEAESRIVGFASLYLPEDFIHLLFVDPGFSGIGAGSKLLQAAVEKMNKPLTLKCVSANHKALKFYEKNGWKKVVEEAGPSGKYWLMSYE
ncbi:GNAT family N-acetyltransferase [Paenibacillus sp. VCA1]|uniref:GNAT family N-acetyltransferase n=1 Tax=Paenibacillus sp. VCA1 TaxID=3039148 RepID=UPI002872525E|nr:GNAT family N-acetyltransferase [Paenibacillus sp. VCA1]MDR9855999.1 GNAT family N-acetyltransferase [Paenibacillus sp. VCA1]